MDCIHCAEPINGLVTEIVEYLDNAPPMGQRKKIGTKFFHPNCYGEFLKNTGKIHSDMINRRP